MKIITKNKIGEIPKGTEGIIVAYEFGAKEGLIVDFPNHQSVFVLKEDISEVSDVKYIIKGTK